MKIGLTYNLRQDYLAQGYSEEETAEFDSPVTVSGIEKALHAMGFATERIGGLERLAPALAAGRRWDLVFNIAEGLFGYGREAQVPALLAAWRIPYTFSDPLVLSLTLHKGLTKRVVRDLGLNTPDFAVVEEPWDIPRVDLPYPLFAKPVAEGTSKGVTGPPGSGPRPSCAGSAWPCCASSASRCWWRPTCPAGSSPWAWWGPAAAPGSWAWPRCTWGPSRAGVYSYDNKEYYEDRVTYSLAQDDDAAAAADLALAAWRGLSCRDGGRVDVRRDESGRASFIEVNPLPGLNPERSDLPLLCGLAGITYRELLGMIVDSALDRAGLPSPAALAAA
jgi:D-alanine-D-alanine ligase